MGRKLRRNQLSERYGGVTLRTIDRWIADEKLGFPKPIYIGGTPMWDEEELEAYERKRAGLGRSKPSPMTVED
jgi:predicted DNA-binding transcriptional regulator AlpA